MGKCAVCGGTGSIGRLWFPGGGGGGIQYPVMFEMLCDKEECDRRSRAMGTSRGLVHEDHRNAIGRALRHFDRFRNEEDIESES